jgi:ECF transporter S component (folate family)
MKFSEYFKPKFQTFDVVFLALLSSFCIIFTAFPPINLWEFQMTFGFLPIAIAAYYYGPIGAVIVSVLGDVIGTFINPQGPFFIGFTISAALTGIIFGFFLYKKPTILKIVIAVAVNQLLVTLLLNSYFLSVLYSKRTFIVHLVKRLLQSSIMFPLQIATIIFMAKVVFKKLEPVIKKTKK